MQKNAPNNKIWTLCMDKPFDLLEYITNYFNDKTYPSFSLIDIFLNDPSYYDKLLDQRSIDARAAYFLSRYANAIQETKGGHSAFRALKYQQLVNDFLNEYTIEHITWDKVEKYLKEQPQENQKTAEALSKKNMPSKKTEPEYPKQYKKLLLKGQRKFANEVLYCPIDLSSMKASYIRLVNIRGKQIIFPDFCCPECARLYTCVDTYEDFHIFHLSGKPYTNINTKKISKQYRPGFVINPYDNRNGSVKEKYTPRKCYVYYKENVKQCMSDGTILIRGYFIDPSGEKRVVYACPKCGTIYLPAGVFIKYRGVFECINPANAEVAINKLLKEQNFKKRNKNNLDADSPDEKIDVSDNSPERKKTIKKQVAIEVKDFIVKRSTLGCSYKKHKIELIDALVNFRDRNGEVRQRLIPAGYCPQCKTYFIMESTLENLKRYGVPLCKIIDEKMYQQIQSGHGLDLAPQSILMQYGYNVSQKDNLSSVQRRGILEMLINERICTKHEIISLLNYFIHMREARDTNMYDLAISKWEADRDYVDNYGVGSHRKVGVGTIRRK